MKLLGILYPVNVCFFLENRYSVYKIYSWKDPCPMAHPRIVSIREYPPPRLKPPWLCSRWTYNWSAEKTSLENICEGLSWQNFPGRYLSWGTALPFPFDAFVLQTSCASVENVLLSFCCRHAEISSSMIKLLQEMRSIKKYMCTCNVYDMQLFKEHEDPVLLSPLFWPPSYHGLTQTWKKHNLEFLDSLENINYIVMHSRGNALFQHLTTFLHHWLGGDAYHSLCYSLSKPRFIQSVKFRRFSCRNPAVCLMVPTRQLIGS